MGNLDRELLTHSRMQVFRLCKGRHHWQYDVGIRSLLEHPALLFGKLLHLWLEAWFRSGWDAAARYLLPELMSALDEYEAAKLRAMCLAYHAKWFPVRGRWRVLAIEVEFRTRIVNPLTGYPSRRYDLGGKIDLIVEDVETGDVWVVEHKSSGSDLKPESTYWRRLRLDPQISIYTTGARELGHDIKGVIYDVVGKPGCEPLKATPPEKRKMTQGKGCKVCGGKVGKAGTGQKSTVLGGGPCPGCAGTGWEDAPRLYADQRERDETPGEYGARCFAALQKEPDAYLHRREVVRLDSEMEAHEHDIWLTARDIAEAKTDGRPSRNPDACFAFYRECDFYDVCCGTASIDDRSRFRVAGQHPELGDGRVHLPVVDDTPTEEVF